MTDLGKDTETAAQPQESQAAGRRMNLVRRCVKAQEGLVGNPGSPMPRNRRRGALPVAEFNLRRPLVRGGPSERNRARFEAA